MKLRRPAPVKRQNSTPPISTATAEPPENAAEICEQAGSLVPQSLALELLSSVAMIECRGLAWGHQQLGLQSHVGMVTQLGQLSQAAVSSSSADCKPW